MRFSARLGERVYALDHKPSGPATAEVELAVKAAHRPQHEACAVGDTGRHSLAQPPAVHAIRPNVEVEVMQVERSIDEPFAIPALRWPNLKRPVQRLRVLWPAAVVDLIAKDERRRRQSLGEQVESGGWTERDAPRPLSELDSLSDTVGIEGLALDDNHVAARPEPDAAQ
jgi:hypothetical protein